MRLLKVPFAHLSPCEYKKGFLRVKGLTGSKGATQIISDIVQRYEGRTHGEPVVRLVLLDLRRRALALLQVRGVRDQVEVAAANDCSERPTSAQITLRCGDG